MALNFGANFLKLILPKELEYKFGITPEPKPMEFKVGEGLTEEQKRKAEIEVRKPIIPVKEPEWEKGAVEKIAFAPKTAPITPELKKEAGLKITEEVGGMVLGAIQPMKQVSKIAEDVLIKNYLTKNVSTEVQQAVKTGIKQKFSDIYTAVVDRFNPIVKMARKVPELKAGENPEILARRYLGIKGVSESKLYWKTFDITTEGNLKITGEGLGNILKPVKDNLDDLRALMVAERDIELTGRGIGGIKPAKKIKLIPEAVIPAEKGIIPKELESLAIEARKYKSAEEFGKAILIKVEKIETRLDEISPGLIKGEAIEQMAVFCII